MLLPFSPSLVVTHQYDAECAQLADRHYSRKTVGSRLFMPSGRKLIIRDCAGLVVFGWLWCEDGYRLDEQTGYNCTIFRNESARLSSEVILECEEMAFSHWGRARVYTYVNPSKVRSPNPGYCFKKAGWKYVGLSKKHKLHLLAKEQ